MAINVTAVRNGLKNALAPLAQNIYTTPDQITPPCFVIGMPDIDYHTAMARGADASVWPVHAVMPRVSDVAAVAQLDAWLAGIGATSVLGAIEVDKTLGGACSATITDTAVPEAWPSAQGDLPSYRFTIQIWG